MRNSVPPQAEVQRQALAGAPVVLNIQCIRLAVPVTRVLNRLLRVRVGKAEQKIGKIVSGVRPVKVERPVGVTEGVLDLCVPQDVPTEFQLVATFAPGEVVAPLVRIGSVAPRPSLRLIVGAGRTVKINLRIPVQVVGSSEQPGYAPPAGLREYARWRDIDPVAVEVEGSLVEQCRADGVDHSTDSAVRRVAERVADGRNVAAAPHRVHIALLDLLGNEVPENRYLVAEV